MTLISSVEHSKYVKLAPRNYVKWAAWILEYEQYKYPDDLEMISRKIVSNLQLKFCPPRYRELNMGNPLFGHCYHEQHWWLQDDDNIIDITAGQYDVLDFDPPYDKGKETKWYGWKNRPHRKTQDLMLLVQPSAKLYFQKYREKPKKSY